MSNSKRFIDGFVQVEMFLKKYLNAPKVGFVQMVHMASKTHTIIKRYSAELTEYSQLRNAIVHNRIGEDVAIAEPHASVVDTLEKIVEELNHPKLVEDLLTDKKLYTSHPNASLYETLQIQKKNHYSVVPIYHNSQFKGLINPRTYQNLLENSEGILDLSKIKIKDVIKNAHIDERIVFVASNTSLVDLIEKFITAQENGKGLIAVLVTKSGQVDDYLLGVFTSADLPRLLGALE